MLAEVKFRGDGRCENFLQSFIVFGTKSESRALLLRFPPLAWKKPEMTFILYNNLTKYEFH